jgi:hypothetical protein
MARTKWFVKMAAAFALAGGLLLLGSAPLRAADFYSCRRNVEKWEARLDHDIHWHGEFSRQANHDRHELAEARQNCDRRYGGAWR